MLPSYHVQRGRHVRAQTATCPPSRPGLVPSGHQETRVGGKGLRLPQQPMMNRLVLLVLAGVMLFCLGVFSLSLPRTAPHVSSALGGGECGACGWRSECSRSFAERKLPADARGGGTADG